MSEAVAASLPVWSIIPFVGMLLSIALFPLVRPHWWEGHELHGAIFWALVFIVPFGIYYGAHNLSEALLEVVVHDYIPFIVLLFGLFVVAGGIAVKGSIMGTTKTNVVMLVLGTVLASWVGTTGAAMLLIRPVIRANAWRKHKVHIVVFFIFLVANIGGCLTPLGDPPLFLGFLRGVPFFWTLHLLPLLLFNMALLIALFVLIDRYYYKKEIALGNSPHIEGEKEPIRIEGLHNLIFLAMIILGVLLNGMLPSEPGINLFGSHEAHIGPNYLAQLILIICAAALSLKTTKRETRLLNSFTFAPIKEVASLFIGIFITMIPALALLRVHGADLGLTHPAQYFWATGALSSFLDNAPTYVVFLTTAGAALAGNHDPSAVSTAVGMVPALDLLAISAGAVFMGANTYIGNAPNFMVKSIAEENRIKMPTFFGYMAWSCAILIPVFILDMFVFFWGH